MAAARSRWVGWWAALAVAAVAGGGLWYAHARGWLAPAYEQVRQWVAEDDAGVSGEGSMDMAMPGMGDAAGRSSEVEGYVAVTIARELQQRIGVEVGRVERAPLRMSVRTVGIIQPDETRVARVHIRTEGWVEELYVNFIGQQVQTGDPLLAIYSPEFLATQQEYLTARRTERSGGRIASGPQRTLAEAALRRLRLWGVSEREIQELERTGTPRETLLLRSPISGTVLQRNVFEEEYITPQRELYVIADLSTVWVQAKVYEYELPHVELGQPATVTVPAVPGREFAGKVVFVQPLVEEATRTVRVRIELPNPEGLLKPDMFAHVEIQHTMGEGLLVPVSAVIRTGERDIAFRAVSEERFVPVEVGISPMKFGEHYRVLEGLEAGDWVVTSANFLIDSESRLRAGGGGGMPGMPGMDMGGMPGMDMGGMEGMEGQGKDAAKAKGRQDEEDKDREGREGMDHSQMKH